MTMVRRKDIWVVGGDDRQAVLAGLLADDGHRVHVFALEERMLGEASLEGIERADCVILPLPAMGADGLLHTPCSRRRLPAGEVLLRLRRGQRVLAGKASPWLKAVAQEQGLQLGDYFAREELALLNAIPTAEGAIRIAMETLPVTLHEARILVIGFGRLGQALGPRLKGLGTEVCIAARRGEQRALAALMNLPNQSLEGLKEWIHSYDLVINTAPALVLGVEELAAMKEGAAVIDLASLPGGVDDDSAAALNVRVIHALALPGKEAPLTAGRYLRDTVYHMLES